MRGAKLSAGRVVRARKLRRNETDAERKLWSMLRNRQLDGHKFVRQFPIGRYVGDFVCREQMLVIEVDGGQHSGSAEDDMRTAYINRRGYSVLRLWNNDVLRNPAGCWDAISLTLRNLPAEDWSFSPAQPGTGLPLTPALSPMGRGSDSPATCECETVAVIATTSPLPNGERDRVRGAQCAEPADQPGERST